MINVYLKEQNNTNPITGDSLTYDVIGGSIRYHVINTDEQDNITELYIVHEERVESIKCTDLDTTIGDYMESIEGVER
jgi:hypothetical protein